MIVPKRKNQKSQNTKNYEYKLNKRFIVEVAFGWFKKYKRLRNRYDKKICNFESFTYFGALSIISKKILKIASFV